MKQLKYKITTYFSIAVISISALVFLIIYLLFSNFRQEEFQTKLKDRTMTTIKFLLEIEDIDNDLLKVIDKNTINSLYDEKILLFDSKKELIYQSIDDTQIELPNDILESLSMENPFIEAEQADYDVIGLHVRYGGDSYFGIAKAYDKFGKRKLNYLKTILLISFLSITLIIILLSYLLSSKISNKLTLITKEIVNLDFQNDKKVSIPNTNDEIQLLAERFNELLDKISQSIKFQKNFIHHVSHELKTPISVLVSNFELLEKENNLSKLHEKLHIQKSNTKQLAEIIASLSELSKAESGQKINFELLRIDELIIGILHDLHQTYPNQLIDLNFSETIDDENVLLVHGNRRLLNLVFYNMVKNALQYSDKNHPLVYINASKDKVEIEVSNDGEALEEEERNFLFNHFFRGKNSYNKKGSGLGLVLCKKILELHQAQIRYESTHAQLNKFTISFSLLSKN